MKVAEILKQKSGGVVTIAPEKMVFDAVQRLVEKNIGSLPVVDASGKLVGIITERDILKQTARNAENLNRTPIREVMTRNLIVGRPEDELKFVEYVMSEKHIRHLPIVRGDVLEGMISIGDVVAAIHHETAEEAHDLRQQLSAHYVVG